MRLPSFTAEASLSGTGGRPSMAGEPTQFEGRGAIVPQLTCVCTALPDDPYRQECDCIDCRRYGRIYICESWKSIGVLA